MRNIIFAQYAAIPAVSMGKFVGSNLSFTVLFALIGVSLFVFLKKPNARSKLA